MIDFFYCFLVALIVIPLGITIFGPAMIFTISAIACYFLGLGSPLCVLLLCVAFFVVVIPASLAYWCGVGCMLIAHRRIVVPIWIVLSVFLGAFPPEGWEQLKAEEDRKEARTTGPERFHYHSQAEFDKAIDEYSKTLNKRGSKKSRKSCR